EAEKHGHPFDVMLLDYYMPGTDGVQVLREIGESGMDTRIILMSGREPADVAVEAMRLGAFDFISKPLNRAELKLRVERALRDRRASMTRGAGGDGKTGADAKGGSDGKARRPRK